MADSKPSTVAELIPAGEASPVREIQPLPVMALQGAESHRLQHFLTLPRGMELEDLLLPDVWSLVARRKLHKHDLIEVVDEAQTFWAALLVLEVGPSHARTALLRRVELPSLVSDVDGLPAGHAVVFLGGARLWGALRGVDVLRAGFPTKTEAAEWLRSHAG